MISEYTLEELYTMNGKPVWVKSLDSKRIDAWHLVVIKPDMAFVQHVGVNHENPNMTYMQRFDFSTYGKTWIAFGRE